MNEDNCLIPRNLRKPDNIIHTPIKLNIKQLVYIGAGIGGAYLAFSTGMPIFLKVTTMAGSLGIGVIGSMFKYEGATLDELAVDSLVYVQRKNYYHQLNKRGGMVVNINTRKEETTAKGVKQVTFDV